MGTNRETEARQEIVAVTSHQGGPDQSEPGEAMLKYQTLPSLVEMAVSVWQVRKQKCKKGR